MKLLRIGPGRLLLAAVVVIAGVAAPRPNGAAGEAATEKPSGAAAEAATEKPSGAAAEAATEEEEMTSNPVIWWEINARDGKVLTEFYETVFGWSSKLSADGVIWHLASGGDAPGTISGGIFTGKGVLPPHRCLYVQVEDVDAVTKKAEEQGREILQGPFDLEGVGRLAFFEDPEGHMIGLIQPAKKPSETE